jgi:hypothetical protein
MLAMASVASIWSDDARDALKSEWKDSAQPVIDDMTKSIGKSMDSFGDSTMFLVKQASSIFSDFTEDLKNSKIGQQVTKVYNNLSQPNALSKGADTVVQALTGDKGATLGGRAYDAIEAAKEGITSLVTGRSAYTAPDVLKRGVNYTGLQAGSWTPDEKAAIQNQQEQGATFRAGTGLTSDIKDKLTATANKYGIDPAAFQGMAQMESRGSANAVSQTGAAGIFQFTGGTARRLGITNRFDVDQNIEGGAKLWKSNADELAKSLGRAPTPQEVYLAHQEGAPGATQIINAAAGKGTISPKVLKNMQVNVGGKDVTTGSPEEAQKFIAANAKAFNASVLAAQNTVPGSTQVAAATSTSPSVSSAGVKSVDGKTPTNQVGTTNQVATPTTQVASTTTQVGTTKQVASTTNQVGTTKQVATPVTQVASTTNQVGTTPVVSSQGQPLVTASEGTTNQPTLTPQLTSLYTPSPVQVSQTDQNTVSSKPSADAATSMAPSTRVSSASEQPTLDSIPMQINDMGLILINAFHT